MTFLSRSWSASSQEEMAEGFTELYTSLLIHLPLISFWGVRVIFLVMPHWRVEQALKEIFKNTVTNRTPSVSSVSHKTTI